MNEDWNYWKLALIGVIGGLIGGAVMWVVMAVVTVIGGQGLWAFLKWVGDVITGDSWQGFNAGNVFTGLAVHVIMSAILGGIFGVIVLPFVSTSRQVLIAGAIWGLVVWLLIGFLAVAAENPTMSQEVPPFPWFIVNVVFGLVVAFIANPLRSTAQVAS